VYFDVGGVVGLDFSKTDKFEDFKKEIKIKTSQFSEFDKFWNKVEPELCIGRETDLLSKVIEKKFNVIFPPDYSILVNGFVNRFEKNESIWPVISEIRKTGGVGLLTNMYPRMFEEIKKRRILPNVDWNVVIDSSLIHIQKPDLGIYKIAEDKSGIEGEEILFIDNTQENLDGVQSFKWKTFLYDPSKPDESSHNLLKYFKENVDH
jgi:FMN phosphatase YigB (HAD superfamily)